MKRREAIQRLAILTAGVAVLPGCFTEDTIFGESLNKIAINGNASSFIDELANVILPVSDLGFETPEPLSQFISSMLNNCHSAEDIQQFGSGYQEYKSYLKEAFGGKLSGLSPNETESLFAAINEEEAMSGNAKYFFKKVKGLAHRHFTTSQKYMEEHNDYEYAPGRYNGCADV